MFAQVTALRYWKSEHHDLSTCEDAWWYDIQKGLFAVADGAGTTSFSDIWADILVKLFVDTPLMSTEEFEVEWWTRLAQERYSVRVPKPETLPWPAQQKAREGSQSTLIGLRVCEFPTAETAHVQLLAFGDSCIFVAQHTEGNADRNVLSFPLERLSDFEMLPICIPSLARVFNRHYHRCKCLFLDLHDADIVVMTTDAVAKWIMSKGGGIYDTVWQTLQVILDQKEDSWPDFIKECRSAGKMLDDDSTALIITLSMHPVAHAFELGATRTHRDDVIQKRREAFEKERAAGNTDMVAVYYGDGIDLKPFVTISREEVEFAQAVADALRELIQIVRQTVNDPQFVTKVQPIWDKYRDLLLKEACAKNIRETLLQKGIVLSRQPTSVRPSPATVVEPSSSRISGSKEAARDAGKMSNRDVVHRSPQTPVPTISPTGDSEAIQGSSAESGTDSQPGASRDDQQTVVARRHPSEIAESSTLDTNLAPQDLRVKLAQALKNNTTLLHEVLTNLEQGALGVRFIQAYFADDDEALLSAYEALAKHQSRLIRVLPEERIDLAKLRQIAAQKFRIALKSRNPRAIASSYDPILDRSNNLTPEERQQLKLVQEYMVALNADNDDAILLARENIEKYHFSTFLIFTSHEDERYQLARRRKEAAREFREALGGKHFIRITEKYASIKKYRPPISDNERNIGHFADLLFENFTKRQAEAFVNIWEGLQLSPYREAFQLLPAEDDFYREAKKELPGRPGINVAVVQGRTGVRMVTHEQFKVAYLFRKSYLQFRIYVLQGIANGTVERDEKQQLLSEIHMLKEKAEREHRAFKEETLDELVDDLLIQEEFDYLRSMSNLDAGQELDIKLQSEFMHFKSYYETEYQAFLKQHHLMPVNMEEALHVFSRRSFMTKHLQGGSEKLIDWLTGQRAKTQMRTHPSRIIVIVPPPAMADPSQKRSDRKFLFFDRKQSGRGSLSS